MKAKTGSPTSKLVLLALAEHMNGQTKLCCPSIRLLAQETELHSRSVQRHLRLLEKLGFIQGVIRKRKDRGQTTTHYKLLLDVVCHPPLAEPHPEPEVKPQESYLLLGFEKNFEDFWKNYPKKDRKVEARLAFQASLSKAPASFIIDRAAAYAGTVQVMFADDPQYVTAPDRWLNGERWMDEGY